MLLVALLAGTVATATATAWRQGMAAADSVGFGSALFLIELAVMVALAGLGASTNPAEWSAVVLGRVAVLGLGLVPRRRPA